jgi:hypothetical protein
MSLHDINIQKDASFKMRFKVLQEDGKTIVGDLTGFSVLFEIFESKDSTTPEHSFVGTVYSASEAVCDVEIDASDTDIDVGSYWGKATVSSGDQVYRPVEGVVYVT